MLSRKIKASKSSYLFALRACSRENNVKEAVLVLHEAESMGMDAPYMYNSTLMLCESLGRFDVAVGIMREMTSTNSGGSGNRGYASTGMPGEVNSDRNITMKTGSPALLSAYRRSSKHGHSVRQSRLYTGTTPPTPSSFVKFHASLKNSKWRNSVLWTARRIISKALTSLTRGFNSVFTEVQDGSIAPQSRKSAICQRFDSSAM